MSRWRCLRQVYESRLCHVFELFELDTPTGDQCIMSRIPVYHSPYFSRGVLRIPSILNVAPVPLSLEVQSTVASDHTQARLACTRPSYARHDAAAIDAFAEDLGV